MDRLVYTALSGMRRAEFAQGITAHNLANVATTGFRRDSGAFQSRFIAGESFETRVQASEQALATNLEPGHVTATGGALDVALSGDAMLAVELPGGGEAYTRRGDLRVGASGMLETGDGHIVVGASGPVAVPPADRIAIGGDGSISIRAAGADAAAALTTLDRIKLVRFDAATMDKGDDGLFHRRAGGETPADDAAQLTSGALEASNVSAAAALVELIEHSRAFELSSKLVGTARDLDQASMALMRLE